MVELSNRGRVALGLAGVAVCAAIVFAPTYLKIQNRFAPLREKAPMNETIQGSVGDNEKVAQKCEAEKKHARVLPTDLKRCEMYLDAFSLAIEGLLISSETLVGENTRLKEKNAALQKEIDDLKATQPKETTPETPKKEQTTKKFNTGAALVESYTGGTVNSWADMQ